MLDEGCNDITIGWWLALFPGTATLTMMLVINLTGDSLRGVLDPRVERMWAPEAVDRSSENGSGDLSHPVRLSTILTHGSAKGVDPGCPRVRVSPFLSTPIVVLALEASGCIHAGQSVS